MKTYIDYCPSAPVSINAELITVPSGPPYVVKTEHNWIVDDSSIEIWENNDKSGTHLVEEAYDGSVSGSGKFQVDYLGASEGDAKYCNKIFFHADQGGLSFYVWYKTEGDVFGADDANSKALKDSDAVEGNLAEFDADGNPVDSGVKPVDLALKDSDAVEGNLAKFDADGNPVDSGISPSNLLQGFSLVQNGSFEIVDSFSVPWCWEKIHADVTVATDTGVKDGYGGTTAIKITSAGSNKEGLKYTFRHLKPSTTYSIYIWMKATSGDTASCWTTGGSDNVSLTSTSTTGEYLTDTFTTDSTPTNIVLCIGSTTNTDIVWFDALTVIEGSTPPDKYLPFPQPAIFEFQDFYPCTSAFPGLETLVGTYVLKKYVYALDDTTEEPLGFNHSIPSNFDPSGYLMIEAVCFPKTAAASKNIQLKYYYSCGNHDESWDLAYSYTVSGDLALINTANDRHIFRFQYPINLMSPELFDVVESKISRIAPSRNNLAGNLYLEKVRIWIPRV